ILYAVNQFVSDVMKPYNPRNIDDMESGLRLKTCQKAFQHQNVLSMEYLKYVLMGKQGFLCQYDRKRGGDTVWSVIYDLNDEKIQFCDGNPSREAYETIKIDF
ncbi:MAG: acyl-CoA--6-aminopenicillanic acid acyltransferase, partial [Holdemania filiformis]